MPTNKIIHYGVMSDMHENLDSAQNGSGHIECLRFSSVLPGTDKYNEPRQNKHTTMKINKWTQVLLGVGLVSIPAVTNAEEKIIGSQAALTSTTISGYVDTTASWKFGTGNANMPGRVYDGADTQDGFNMNVVSMTLNKPLDEGEWASGYNVQFLFGEGARKRGTGLSTGAGGVAFNEAVVLLRAPVGNGIDLKIGQFGTYNGYEAYDTYKNPNWSRSYGFFIESSAHTGVSASYRFSDSVSVMAGVGNMAGFNNQVDAKYTGAESKKAYLGMITFTAPESFGFLKGASLSAGYTGGVNGPTSSWMQDNYYVGASVPTPISGLAAGLAFDYTRGIAIADSDSYALGAYLSLQATEKLKLNGRVDYGWGDDTMYYSAAVAGGNAGERNKLLSLTGTADYTLWKNVISRAELRWDTCLTGDSPFGGTAAGTPTDKNAVSLTANLIYQF